MGKKLILNVFYNIGIFICLITGYQYGIVQKQYGYIAGAVIILAILVVLKIRLIKEIKNAQKNP
jgi:hypothetical protein